MASNNEGVRTVTADPLPMNKNLRVLFVDDCEDDTLLLLRELTRAGYRVESQRVYTLAALGEALREGGWELLVSDFNLPGFTCLDVLPEVRRVDPDLPVIVISGTMGEEVAVEVMHAGAHDYILKDRLSNRLIPAIERELAEIHSRRERRRVLRELASSEERFRQLTESIEETFWLIDLHEETVLYVSPSFELLWERRISWLMGHPAERLLESIHPEDFSRIVAELTTHGWPVFNEEYRIVRPSGEERWVHTRSFPVHDSDGRVSRIASVSLDVTERRRMQMEMQTMISALEQSADAVMITDSAGIIEYVNPAFENISGFERREVLGRQPNLLKSGFQDSRFYERVWGALKSGLPFSDIFVNRRKDGELYYEAKTITPIRDANGVITHYVATGNDITKRLRTHERLQQMVNYDVVTGLASRILLVDRLEQAMLEARRHGGRVAVLAIDIGLSGVCGAEKERGFAERLLQVLAKRLREIVGGGATLARLNREEFVVMARSSGAAEELDRLALAISVGFSEPVAADGYQIYITPAIGISLFPDDAAQTEPLLEHATTAMRHARQIAHQPYAFYQKSMSESVGRLPS